MEKFTEITIPEGVEIIGSRAFSGNNFKKISVPSSVKEIGSYAFSTIEGLEGETELILSEGLETIGTYAFRNKNIPEVNLPTTVTKLPKNVFQKSSDVVTKVYVTTDSSLQRSYLCGSLFCRPWLYVLRAVRRAAIQQGH